MGFSGAKVFRGQKLYSLFLMQLCHFDLGLSSFIFQRGTRFGKPSGKDQVLQDAINDNHELLFVAEFPLVDFARLIMLPAEYCLPSERLD